MRGTRSRTRATRANAAAQPQVSTPSNSSETPSTSTGRPTASSSNKDKNPSSSPTRPSTSTVTSDGSRSPEQNCPICLSKKQNNAFTDACCHEFCFNCLREWSQVRALCPLCKHPFKKIIHNVRDMDDYDVYVLADHQPPPPSYVPPRYTMPSFRYRTTVTGHFDMVSRHIHDRINDLLTGGYASGAPLQSLPDRNAYDNVLAGPAGPRRARSRWDQTPEAVALPPPISQVTAPVSQHDTAFRASVYSQRLAPRHRLPRNLRSADPAFFRDNPACTHRLVPWLSRELCVFQRSTRATSLTRAIDHILELIRTHPIRSPEFRAEVARYTGEENADRFVTEFFSFARSPLEMHDYDLSLYYLPEIYTLPEPVSPYYATPPGEGTYIDPPPGGSPFYATPPGESPLHATPHSPEYGIPHRPSASAHAAENSGPSATSHRRHATTGGTAWSPILPPSHSHSLPQPLSLPLSGQEELVNDLANPVQAITDETVIELSSDDDDDVNIDVGVDVNLASTANRESGYSSTRDPPSTSRISIAARGSTESAGHSASSVTTSTGLGSSQPLSHYPDCLSGSSRPPWSKRTDATGGSGSSQLADTVGSHVSRSRQRRHRDSGAQWHRVRGTAESGWDSSPENSPALDLLSTASRSRWSGTSTTAHRGDTPTPPHLGQASASSPGASHSVSDMGRTVRQLLDSVERRVSTSGRKRKHGQSSSKAHGTSSRKDSTLERGGETASSAVSWSTAGSGESSGSSSAFWSIDRNRFNDRESANESAAAGGYRAARHRNAVRFTPPYLSRLAASPELALPTTAVSSFSDHYAINLPRSPSNTFTPPSPGLSPPLTRTSHDETIDVRDAGAVTTTSSSHPAPPAFSTLELSSTSSSTAAEDSVIFPQRRSSSKWIGVERLKRKALRLRRKKRARSGGSCSGSEDSDVLVTKVEKPWQERTPINLLSSDGEDTMDALEAELQEEGRRKEKHKQKKKKKKRRRREGSSRETESAGEFDGSHRQSRGTEEASGNAKDSASGSSRRHDRRRGSGSSRGEANNTRADPWAFFFEPHRPQAVDGKETDLHTAGGFAALERWSPTASTSGEGLHLTSSKNAKKKMEGVRSRTLVSTGPTECGPLGGQRRSLFTELVGSSEHGLHTSSGPSAEQSTQSSTQASHSPTGEQEIPNTSSTNTRDAVRIEPSAPHSTLTEKLLLTTMSTCAQESSVLALNSFVDRCFGQHSPVVSDSPLALTNLEPGNQRLTDVAGYSSGVTSNASTERVTVDGGNLPLGSAFASLTGLKPADSCGEPVDLTHTATAQPLQLGDSGGQEDQNVQCVVGGEMLEKAQSVQNVPASTLTNNESHPSELPAKGQSAKQQLAEHRSNKIHFSIGTKKRKIKASAKTGFLDAAPQDGTHRLKSALLDANDTVTATPDSAQTTSRVQPGFVPTFEAAAFDMFSSEPSHAIGTAAINKETGESDNVGDIHASETSNMPEAPGNPFILADNRLSFQSHTAGRGSVLSPLVIEPDTPGHASTSDRSSLQAKPGPSMPALTKCQEAKNPLNSWMGTKRDPTRQGNSDRAQQHESDAVSLPSTFAACTQDFATQDITQEISNTNGVTAGVPCPEYLPCDSSETESDTEVEERREPPKLRHFSEFLRSNFRSSSSKSDIEFSSDDSDADFLPPRKVRSVVSQPSPRF